MYQWRPAPVLLCLCPCPATKPQTIGIPSNKAGVIRQSAKCLTCKHEDLTAALKVWHSRAQTWELHSWRKIAQKNNIIWHVESIDKNHLVWSLKYYQGASLTDNILKTWASCKWTLSRGNVSITPCLRIFQCEEVNVPSSWQSVLRASLHNVASQTQGFLWGRCEAERRGARASGRSRRGKICDALDLMTEWGLFIEGCGTQLLWLPKARSF